MHFIYLLVYVFGCNPATEFECTNGLCIPWSKVNNTINDCQDNSDEGIN